jgi:hypothetical protein
VNEEDCGEQLFKVQTRREVGSELSGIFLRNRPKPSSEYPVKAINDMNSKATNLEIREKSDSLLTEIAQGHSQTFSYNFDISDEYSQDLLAS